MNKKTNLNMKILFFIIIFLVIFFIWMSPVIFKGHAPYKMVELMPIAKNLHNTGEFSLENNKSVYLASSLIKEEGETATVGNKLTAYLYSYLFKITGVLSPDKLVLFSIFINALTLVIFSYIVFRLFGFAVSGLFSLVYILIPHVWFQIYSLGTYEFALFFLALFFLFFVLGREKKYEWLWLALAGTFLALSALAKETFFLLIPIFILYLWFNRKRKQIIYFLAPTIFILAVFYAPNAYSNLFSSGLEKERFIDSSFYDHLYPDPYIYNFEKESYLENYKKQAEDAGFLESLQMKKVLANMGEKGIGLGERIFLGTRLLFGHIMKFVSLEEVGSPFALFFAVLGMVYIREKDKNLFNFSLYWIFGTIFLLSFAALVSRSHIMDFAWLIPLLAALGIFYLFEKIDMPKFTKITFCSVLIFAFLYSILLSDHLRFGKLYDGDRNLKLEAYTDKIKKTDIGDRGVIAVGLNARDEAILNYLSDKSIVTLSPETIEKLIKENKLQEVFDYFGVKYILGYGDNLSEKILKQARVADIASDSVEIKKTYPTSLKSLISNLIS